MVLLDFNVNCNNFWDLEKCDFLFFSFFELFLPLLLTISKIESVKLKYVIIAKMDLKVLENGLQNNFQI